MELFTDPWPGPGNSEGPVDPEEWVEPQNPRLRGDTDEDKLLMHASWPGPGDSEG